MTNAFASKRVKRRDVKRCHRDVLFKNVSIWRFNYYCDLASAFECISVHFKSSKLRMHRLIYDFFW